MRQSNSGMAAGVVSRREWLSLAAVTVVAGRDALARQPDRRWGVQLYTVRGLLAKDAAATLERVAAIGYKELEVLQPTLDVVAPMARKLGMTIVSAHLDAATSTGAGISAFLDKARTHFSTKTMVEKTLGVYDEVLQASRRPGPSTSAYGRAT